MTMMKTFQSAVAQANSEPVAVEQDWTISKLLTERFPDVRLRQRFKQAPYLEQVTLRQVLKGPSALQDFLEHCRQEPACGDLSIKRLREVIEYTALEMARR